MSKRDEVREKIADLLHPFTPNIPTMAGADVWADELADQILAIIRDAGYVKEEKE